MPREFPTEDVLSVTDGRLLCDMVALRRVFEHMLGNAFVTDSALVATKTIVAEAILRQIPLLDPAGPAYAPLSNLLAASLGAGGSAYLEAASDDEVIRGWLETHVYPVFGRTVSLEPLATVKPGEAN